MPQYRKLKEMLLSAVANLLEGQGFKRRKGHQSFILKKPFGYLSFHLAFIPHHKVDFDVTADAAVRINAIEDLINEGKDYLSKAEKKQTATIGAELGNISVGAQMRWTVTSDADIYDAAQSIVEAFNAIGRPYLGKYSDLQAIFDGLSQNEKKSWKLIPFRDERCKVLVALAFILGKFDLIDSLTGECSSFLKEINDHGLQEFEKFAIMIRGRLNEKSKKGDVYI